MFWSSLGWVFLYIFVVCLILSLLAAMGLAITAAWMVYKEYKEMKNR